MSSTERARPTARAGTTVSLWLLRGTLIAALLAAWSFGPYLTAPGRVAEPSHARARLAASAESAVLALGAKLGELSAPRESKRPPLGKLLPALAVYGVIRSGALPRLHAVAGGRRSAFPRVVAVRKRIPRLGSEEPPWPT